MGQGINYITSLSYGKDPLHPILIIPLSILLMIGTEIITKFPENMYYSGSKYKISLTFCIDLYRLRKSNKPFNFNAAYTLVHCNMDPIYFEEKIIRHFEVIDFASLLSKKNSW